MDLIRIAGGDWEATIAPDDGAGITRLRAAGRDVLVPAPEGIRLGGPFGAFWMIPWANRLDHGRLGPYRLPVNRPQDETAIHGLSRNHPWMVEDAAPDRAVLVQAIDTTPYRYATTLVVEAGEDGFALDLAVTNTGGETLPFGFGWHPWFARPAGTHLAFHAAHRCTHDARGLPVSASDSEGLDGGEDVFLGLDTHFAGWDGAVRIAWPEQTLTMSATGALATNLQVYAPLAIAVLCVEPSSHLPDVANRPELADLGPMRLLDPGATLRGSIRLRAESSHPPGGPA